MADGPLVQHIDQRRVPFPLQQVIQVVTVTLQTRGVRGRLRGGDCKIEAPQGVKKYLIIIMTNKGKLFQYFS